MRDKIVSVDLGFGYCKGKKGDKYYTQPSVIGEPRMVFEDDLNNDDLQYESFSLLRSYFVGNLAVRKSNVRYYSTGDNKYGYWITSVMLDTMLGCLAPNEENNILITGLPIDFYFSQINKVKEFLGQYTKRRYFGLKIGRNNPETVSVQASKVHVVPQPMGAAMNYLLDDDGRIKDKDEARKIFVIGDLGFHTFDLLVLDGMEIHRYSHSDTEISVATAYTQVQEWLKNQVGYAPDLYQVDAAMLKGDFQGIDLSPILTKMCESLAYQIELAVESLNLRFHKYIGTGGWSTLITPMLNIPEEKKVMFGQDGNVQGYEKIGVRAYVKENA